MIFISCERQNETKKISYEETSSSAEIKYAKRFAIVRRDSCTVVYLFGNRANQDTTEKYVLCDDTLNRSHFGKDFVFIHRPVKKLAALSSIYASMLIELGAINNIVAIDNIDYVNNKELLDKYHRGEILELAKSPDIDIEKAVQLNPDIIFTFGMGTNITNDRGKLALTKIPVAISVDHLEETPLARAEWIKFFAAFVNQGERADSIFSDVEKKYLELKDQTQNLPTKPTVFSETKYGDVWYMPGGKSYMSALLKDAGANYLWSDNENFGSLPLSFEQVYAKARNSDYWINLPMVNSRKELIAFESRYAEFKAFKEGKIYNNTKVKNEKGYSIYWETGMIHPERILSDLVSIFHPDKLKEDNHEMYYYEQLK